VLPVAEYSIFIRPDLLQKFWQVMSDGGLITDAVAVIETSRPTGRRVLVEAGGIRPRRGRGLKGRCLSFAEREEIALARAAGESMRSIAERLGRSPSTISRELVRRSACGTRGQRLEVGAAQLGSRQDQATKMSRDAMLGSRGRLRTAILTSVYSVWCDSVECLPPGRPRGGSQEGWSESLGGNAGGSPAKPCRTLDRCLAGRTYRAGVV
jgi:hypothetical protein